VVTVEVDKGLLQHMEIRLKGLEDKGTAALKNAINQTAKEIVNRLALEAGKEYTIKKTDFRKSMKTKKATIHNTEALVSATGKVQDIKGFRVSPSTYDPKNRPKGAVRAKVLSAGRLKPLEKGKLKAFVAKFKTGHIAVVQRTGRPPTDSKGKMKSKLGRRYIKKLFSPSIPVMLGNEKRVYGKIEADVKDYLRDNLNRQIGRILGGQ
jgi:hypothetical protein